MARSPGFFLLSFRGTRETLRDALLRSATCRSMELTSGMNTIIPLYEYIRNGGGKEKKVKKKKKGEKVRQGRRGKVEEKKGGSERRRGGSGRCSGEGTKKIRDAKRPTTTTTTMPR